MSKPSVEEWRFALLGYATALFIAIHLVLCIAFFGFIVLLNQNKNNSFSVFHLRQMAGIISVAVLISVFANALPAGIIPVLLTLFLILLAILGFVSAYRNQKDELPFIGTYFQKWFQFIK